MPTGATDVPERTDAQRREALGKANHTRSHRARLKRDIAAGRVNAAVALDDPTCATMRIGDLLLAVPKLGRVKVNQALRRAHIAPSKRLGGLSPRQRDEVTTILQRRGAA